MVPDAPMALRLVDKTHSSITVKWDPQFDGGKTQTFLISINETREVASVNDTCLIEGNLA